MILMFVAAAVAASSPAQADTTPKAKPAKICRLIPTVSSRLPPRRVCRTPDGWAAMGVSMDELGGESR